MDLLNELGHDLEVFQIHSPTFASNPSIGNELMEVFVEIIQLWAQTVHFLNRNKHGTGGPRMDLPSQGLTAT